MIEILLEDHLRGFTGKRILDIGPGYSSFSRLSARITGAEEITFVDFDQAVLAWQLNASRNAGLNAHLLTIRLDEDGIDSLPGTYDVIHCQEVLEHLLNAPRVLRALGGKLRQGGRMIITVPTKVSERWLQRLNPAYMRNAPFGHVNQYDQKDLRELVRNAGLSTSVLIPTQPHYFLAHLWFYGSRMQSEPSSGKILTGGIRGAVFSRILRYSRWIFIRTNPLFWGKLFPRNYFVIATKPASAETGVESRA